jgi:hypothetical protein
MALLRQVDADRKHNLWSMRQEGNPAILLHCSDRRGNFQLRFKHGRGIRATSILKKSSGTILTILQIAMIPTVMSESIGFGATLCTDRDLKLKL